MAVRHYRLEFTTIGPAHIGDGNKLGKADYFRLDNNTVAVLDVARFIDALSDKDFDTFCAFLENPAKRGFQDFLDEHKHLETAARKSVAYKLSTKLTANKRGDYQYFDVYAFIKDAYGNPYVPGSSVKGVLRTALLTALLQQKDRSDLRKLADEGVRKAKHAKGSDAKKPFARELNTAAFFTAELSSSSRDAINDVMRYVSVSDSQPLDVQSLAFVKKYDLFAKEDEAAHKASPRNRNAAIYQGNELNIYRECLAPGTRIVCNIDIDERIDEHLGFTLDAAGLANVLHQAQKLYERTFESYFPFDKEEQPANGGLAACDDGICQYIAVSGPLAGSRCRNKAIEGIGYCNTHKNQAQQKEATPAAAGATATCFLGGGVGFASKSVLNAAYDNDEERVEQIAQLLYSQFPSELDTKYESNKRLAGDIKRSGFAPKNMRARRRGSKMQTKEDHRHWKDPELGVSPHTLKLGKIGDKEYLMGKCEVRITERSVQ